MAKNFLQEGEVMVWTNITASAVVSGQVVAMGNILGVAEVDIAVGASGSVGFGVYRVPKVAGAVIVAGDSLLWDASASGFDDNAAVAAAGDIGGSAAVAFETAGAGVTTLAVKFTGVPGTKT